VHVCLTVPGGRCVTDFLQNFHSWRLSVRASGSQPGLPMRHVGSGALAIIARESTIKLRGRKESRPRLVMLVMLLYAPGGRHKVARQGGWNSAALNT
jgi:hypothetical protein